jgi:hypothetical protein
MTATPDSTSSATVVNDPRRDLAQLLIPAIQWNQSSGFGDARPLITEALALGVGGFLLLGGEQDVVRALAKELQIKSKHPLLIAADLERGAGQQFDGATGLPPVAAIAATGDMESLKRAARLTAREARTMGVICRRCATSTCSTKIPLLARAHWAEIRGKLVNLQLHGSKRVKLRVCLPARSIFRDTVARFVMRTWKCLWLMPAPKSSRIRISLLSAPSSRPVWRVS